jgi:hypothetical protein
MILEGNQFKAPFLNPCENSLFEEKTVRVGHKG